MQTLTAPQLPLIGQSLTSDFFLEFVSSHEACQTLRYICSITLTA